MEALPFPLRRHRHASGAAWRPPIQSRAARDALLPILFHGEASDGEPMIALDDPDLEGALRDGAVSFILAGVIEIDALWRKRSHAARAAGASGKVGRNSPCPCGSGRKRKKCCERVHQAPAH